MLNTIEKILTSKPGSITFVLGFMVILVFGSVFVTKLSTDQDGLKKSVERIENKLEKMDERFNKIENDISLIKGILEYQFSLKDASTQKKSPLILTELGKKIVKANNLKEIVDDNWTKISDFLKSTNLTHPFDIERFCIERTFVTPEKFFSENDIEKLNTIVYKNDYHFIQISRIMSVLIIERYFAENKIVTTN